MEAFTTFTGLVAPLDQSNVDTDQIIPKQFLKAIGRTGFGENLFDGWRYLDQGEPGMTPNERQINPEFVLNSPRYQGASILLARENFGCGSSREHAVWALREYGFRAVIAPSFADIFYTNCFKNGFLPIVLEEEVIEELFAGVLGAAAGEGVEMTIDLPSQTVQGPGVSASFEIDAFRKRCLIEGLDEIALTLAQSDDIRAYEQRRAQAAPWLF